MGRDWKEAKPKWVVEAAQAEMATLTRRLALRWPDEARPTPVPFQWGDYDNLSGSPLAGTYWAIGRGHFRNTVEVTIREKENGEPGWKKWRFKEGKIGEFTTTVFRGPLYETEHEAILAALWAECDEAAARLERAWAALHKDRGFV